LLLLILKHCFYINIKRFLPFYFCVAKIKGRAKSTFNAALRSAKGGAKGYNEVRAKGYNEVRAKGYNEVRAKSYNEVRAKGYNEVRAKGYNEVRAKSYNEVRAKMVFKYFYGSNKYLKNN